MRKTWYGFGLAAIFLAVAGAGIYLGRPGGTPLREPTIVSCEDPSIWTSPSNRGVESESCPIGDVQQAKVVFWNRENYGPERQLILAGSVKRYSELEDPREEFRILMESEIIEFDKTTHRAIRKFFHNSKKSGGIDGYFPTQEEGGVSNDITLEEVATMNSNSYYVLQIQSLRVLIGTRDNFLVSDHYQSGMFLFNVLFHTTTVKPYERAFTAKLFSFCYVVPIALYLLFVVGRSLRLWFAYRTFLLVMFAISCVLYTCPFEIPTLKKHHPYLLFVFFSHATLDALFTFSIPQSRIRDFLTFVLTFVTLLVTGFRSIAIRDTLEMKEVYWIPTARDYYCILYEENSRVIALVKMLIQVALALIFICRRSSHSIENYQAYLPALLCSSVWLHSFLATKMVLKYNENNIPKLFLDFLFVPLVLLTALLTLYHKHDKTEDAHAKPLQSHPSQSSQPNQPSSDPESVKLLSKSSSGRKK